jgi:hypothetical protein
MNGNCEIDSDDGVREDLFIQPVINLHLPYGSKYSLNFTPYKKAHTYNGKTYSVGYTPIVNYIYDYDGNEILK